MFSKNGPQMTRTSTRVKRIKTKSVLSGFHLRSDRRHLRAIVFPHAVATTTEYPRFSITSQPPNASKISGTTAVGIFVTM
jgi:hypothetical protein